LTEGLIYDIAHNNREIEDYDDPFIEVLIWEPGGIRDFQPRFSAAQSSETFLFFAYPHKPSKEVLIMEFDFSDDILEDAKELAVEMLQTGEKIREMKVGVFGRIYLSSDEELVKWIKSFTLSGSRFFIGAKK
jgi:hypothetical protein